MKFWSWKLIRFGALLKRIEFPRWTIDWLWVFFVLNQSFRWFSSKMKIFFDERFVSFFESSKRQKIRISIFSSIFPYLTSSRKSWSSWINKSSFLLISCLTLSKRKHKIICQKVKNDQWKKRKILFELFIFLAWRNFTFSSNSSLSRFNCATVRSTCWHCCFSVSFSFVKLRSCFS